MATQTALPCGGRRAPQPPGAAVAPGIWTSQLAPVSDVALGSGLGAPAAVCAARARGLECGCCGREFTCLWGYPRGWAHLPVQLRACACRPHRYLRPKGQGQGHG